MRAPLRLHPQSRCDAVTAVEVEASRLSPTEFALRYVATGAVENVRVPPHAGPERTNELWRHTCFEAFLARPGGWYAELNLSPSSQWAGYGFDGYRTGMTPLALEPPHIETAVTHEQLLVEARVELEVLKTWPGWRLGLAAVIEETDGRLSHWALAHPPGRPDFHHEDSFTLTLPEAEGE